jgi:hypothetical protein
VKYGVFRSATGVHASIDRHVASHNKTETNPGTRGADPKVIIASAHSSV